MVPLQIPGILYLLRTNFAQKLPPQMLKNDHTHRLRGTGAFVSLLMYHQNEPLIHVCKKQPHYIYIYILSLISRDLWTVEKSVLKWRLVIYYGRIWIKRNTNKTKQLEQIPKSLQFTRNPLKIHTKENSIPSHIINAWYVYLQLS